MDIELLDLTIKLFALALQKVVYEPLVQDGECLTQVQENCLRFIYFHQTPMVKDVAEGLQISNAAVTKLIDRLEKKGLVRREYSRTDRRQILLSLTPAGVRLLENARRQSLQRLQAIVERLAPESLAAFEQSLHDFLEATLIDNETLDQICLRCGLAHLNECPGNLICRELTGRDRVPN
ncbi:MAG TPA: MarR family transcriptional regulator [Firmicutes bacterium]|uniref:MarR family transcriptional regulator n=1 Tax=Capillibacterium thermochitinicola TaxID=2699427 RepID=A0A8J6LHM1_9FIRM|nr:MarR family transcriptional regulator [Capillibacterium thermochitinicola]MBA2132350.1 MarR family transcriptional regulator [Capillibacterium thermochitinicola]HHW12589.1 MarR family transcriptional regulator [Bacillota bacterium]